MNFTMRISFRNLARQKRRSILLGAGIGFGVMFLVIIHSFADGVSDTILNRFLVNAFSHISVHSSENVEETVTIIRDKDEIINKITSTLDGIKSVKEEVGTMVRAVGNKGSDYFVLAGISNDGDYLFDSLFKVIEGNFDDFRNSAIENPLILFSDKAKALNVKPGDKVNIKLTTIYGQMQSARLTLVAIIKSKNPISDIYNFIPLKDVKRLMGFQPHETGGLQITLKHVSDPKTAIYKADKLHKALTPKPALIYGTFQFNENLVNATAMAFDSENKAIDLLKQQYHIIKGNLEKKDSVAKEIIVNESMAKALHAGIGDMVSFYYDTRFKGTSPLHTYKISAIIAPKSHINRNIAILTKTDLYDIYYKDLPNHLNTYQDAFIPKEDDPVFQALAPSWTLMQRTRTSQDNYKKWADHNKTEWKGQVINVSSFHELFMADIALKFEAGMKVICKVAFIIVFFIIFVGLVNTLRMTIRERTREIGTIRAIGMQGTQVCSSFIQETIFLSLFGYAVGIVAGLFVIYLLAGITFPQDISFGILLEEGHLHFIFNIRPILTDLIIIFVVTVITAYFPIKRAANLSVADALRHYE